MISTDAFQFSLNNLLSPDILVWMIGIPLLLAALWFFFYQRQLNQSLHEELTKLSKMKRNNIEYELVLKAMKLATWRVDVPSRSMTVENDFRDKVDDYLPAPGTPLETVYQQLVAEDRERFAESMGALAEGRIDELHEQYRVQVPHTDHTYWGESYAMIDKRDLEGKPLSLVGTSMRIDDQKQIEQALIEARNQAEESDRLKSAFLANMSHEIRTPLNAIVGFSDILPMAQSEEERQQLIGLIKQNNAHLLRLFDDMVNMSKLEAGSGNQLVKSTFSLKPLFDELAQQYAQSPQLGQVSIVVGVEDDTLTVTTDRQRLREILNQYMNNAVKFTQQGSITMGYEPLGDRLRLYVKDTGKGIPADKCDDRLFERFVKVDEFIPGTGLGLSICRSLALNLGAKVGVASTLGEGSTFWVDLPLE